jgi:protein TIF31
VPQGKKEIGVLNLKGQQVGIEIAPRDYDLDTPSPFRTGDIISMIPVYKVEKVYAFSISLE